MASETRGEDLERKQTVLSRFFQFLVGQEESLEPLRQYIATVEESEFLDVMEDLKGLGSSAPSQSGSGSIGLSRADFESFFR